MYSEPHLNIPKLFSNTHKRLYKNSRCPTIIDTAFCLLCLLTLNSTIANWHSLRKGALGSPNTAISPLLHRFCISYCVCCRGGKTRPPNYCVFSPFMQSNEAQQPVLTTLCKRVPMSSVFFLISSSSRWWQSGLWRLCWTDGSQDARWDCRHDWCQGAEGRLQRGLQYSLLEGISFGTNRVQWMCRMVFTVNRYWWWWLLDEALMPSNF